MTGEVVIDGALFLGMHATDEDMRRSCKAFFCRHLHDEVTMSLEHVGWCDDVVWAHPRAVQDAYYPFMDTLHTDMTIHRVGYEQADIDSVRNARYLADLPMRERLLLGLVLRRGAVLHTASPRLRTRHDLPLKAVPAAAAEDRFPQPLEQRYQVSLALRLPIEEL